MNEKELRKISRSELLELLLKQTDRIKELENDIDKANKKLENKKISLNEAGSIAEASLKITDLFNKAEEACKIYTDNVSELNKRIEKEVHSKYEKLEKKKLAETEKKCKKKIDDVNKQINEKKKELALVQEEINKLKENRKNEEKKLREEIREEFRKKYEDKLKKKLAESKSKEVKEENTTEIIKDNVKVVNKKSIRNKKVSRKK